MGERENIKEESEDWRQRVERDNGEGCQGKEKKTANDGSIYTSLESERYSNVEDLFEGIEVDDFDYLAGY